MNFNKGTQSFLQMGVKTWLMLITFGYAIQLSAQGENNIWAFGNGCGLDFNSGGPVFVPTSMYSREGCAAISDAFGNLLFYTSGNMVWDRNGNPMPHGNILGNPGNGSATQGALILKSISNPNEYYLFTLDASNISINTKLRYSIVNMTLNNGMGDIRADKKDIELADDMEERMFAVESESCGYWIVAHKRNSRLYVSFQLTAAGLHPPVYSNGSLSDYGAFGGDIGEMKISPDRSKIALMFRNNSAIELAEFDPLTGIISNASVLDSTSIGTSVGYGLAFSPDNSKLYATVNDLADLYQYDMALYPNTIAMKNNKLLIDGGNQEYGRFIGTRLGPDGKIYVVNWSSGYVYAIEAPDNPGLSCDLDTQSVFIPPSTYFYNPTHPFYTESFGNPTVTITYKDTLPGRYTDTLICFSDSALLAVPDNLLGYVWSDGERGASRYVHEEGLYVCLSTQNCTMRMDTFKVTFVKGNLDLGPDTTLCPGDSLMLHVSGNGFEWQDGSRDSVYTVKDPGAYSVTLNQQGCHYTDTIHVDIYDPKAIILETDTLICTGDKLILHGASQPSGSYLWSTGAETPEIETGESGTYRLQADNICGSFYDSVTVTVQDCDCRPGLPNAFSPNGDGLNDFFKPVLNCFTQGFNLAVYNRYGQRLFSSFNQENGWDGTFRNQPLEMGTYFYTMQYETPNGEVISKKGDFILLR